MYWGSFAGKVAIIDLDAVNNLASGPSSATKFLTTTAGNVLTIRMVNLDSSVNRFTHAYIGSSSSIISKWNVITERIESLFVYSDPGGFADDIYSIEYDTTRQVIWAATGSYGDNVRIVRVQDSGQDLVQIDQIDYDTGSADYVFPKTLLVDTLGNQVVIGTKNDKIIRFNITNCAGSCQACAQLDNRYCGFCLVDATCTMGRFCSSEWIQSADSCPRTLSIAPPAGATDGGTLVAVQGTKYVANRIGDYRCQFSGGGPFDPVSLNATHIVCQSPSAPGAQSSTLTILYKGQVWNDAVGYRYYSCDRGCDTCFAESECGWCLRSSACSSVRQCVAADFDTLQCPVISSVIPESAETVASAPVVVTVSRVISGTYTCRFGPLAPVAASAITTGAPGSITCPSPTGGAASFVNLTVELQSTRYAPSSVFEFYSCSSGDPCFSCVSNAHPNCIFCLPTLSCQRSSNSTCPGQIPGRSCPLLSSLSPVSISISSIAGKNLTLIGSIAAVANMACDWGTAVRTPASSLNATHISCSYPANPTPGDVLVSLYSGNTPYSNPLPFRFYDCNLLSFCSLCLDPLHAECSWCVGGGALRCSLTSNASSACGGSPLVGPGGQCPRILSISPDNAAQDGRMNITVSLSSAPSAITSIQCRFGASILTDALVSGASVTCPTPSFLPSVGNVSVEIILNGKSFAGSTFLRVYNCSSADDGTTLSSCGACLQASRPFCTWCASTACSSTSSCLSGTITQCPALISVAPESGSADGGETVVVRAVSLPQDTSSLILECAFGSSRVEAVLAAGGTSVLCVSPASVSIGTVSLRLLVNGVPFAPETLSFRYFRCNSGLPSCLSACFVDPSCGWCVTTGTCSSQPQCARGTDIAISPLWLNGTCLSASVSPNHVQVGERYDSQRLIFNIPSLPAARTPTAKRALPANLQLFQCAFDPTGNVTTNVTEFTATTAVCELPFSDAPIQSAARLLYAGHEMTLPSSFTFIDCRTEIRCGRCILSPICGWCLQSAACATELSCTATGLDFSKQDCPQFRSLTPQLGVNTGGDSITVLGDLFVNSTGWSVTFDNTTSAPAAWVSSSSLTFVTPALVGKIGQVNVTLKLNGVQYSDTPVLFTLSEPPTQVAASSNVALGAGLGAGLAVLVLIAAIVIAIIIARRRKSGMYIQVKEPDYQIVAFGDFLQPKFKMPKDNLDILAIKLLDKTHGLLLSIEGGTSPTEADLVARALTYIYAAYPGKAEEAIQTLVSGEIGRTKQETTLFRQNSMASKMFKFYSKVVGIRYLWKTLARFIAEINHLAAEATAGRGAKSGESLIAVDIEIDNDKMVSQDDQELIKEANILQLNLTCQKVFNACRTNLNVMPFEFKRIFRQMQWQLLAKWSDMEIVFKAVGGFLYLRFLCPAITAPHAYGLLENPPNEAAQRQLVLIGKVIQNLANLTPPGAKEAYMQSMDNFYDKNLDRMRDFYKELLRDDVIDGETEDTAVVTEVVKHNSLATVWNHLLTYRAKVETAAAALPEEESRESGTSSMKELIDTYGDKKVSKAKSDGKSDK
jgi:hypothetical protein